MAEPRTHFCPWCGAYLKGNPCRVCSGEWTTVKAPTRKKMRALGWHDDAEGED